MDQARIVLLDVMVENLQNTLFDKGWNVKTVTAVLGSTKEGRDDTKIIEYARDNSCAVITGDRKFVKRLREECIAVFTVTDAEMTDIIHQKLLLEFD